MPDSPEIVDADAFEPEIEFIGRNYVRPRRRNINRPRIEIVLSDDEPIPASPSRSPIKRNTKIGSPSSFDKTTRKRALLGGSNDGARPKIWSKKELVTPTPSSKIAPADDTRNIVAVRQLEEKRKRKKYPKYIALHDDDSTDEVREQLTFQRARLSDSSDSDDNYANAHSALDDSLENWQPFRERNPEISVAKPLQHSLDSPESDITSQNIKTRRNITGRFSQYQVPMENSGTPHIWTVLRNSRLNPACSSQPSAPMESRRTTLLNDLHFHTLELVSSFRQAPGSVNKISQSPGIIAICTSTVGGQPDEDDEVPNTYNCAGSLMVCYDGKVQTVQGHDKEIYGDNSELFHKYYTINDVTFDPRRPTCMVTSGNDKVVRLWSCSLDNPSSLSVCLEHTISYNQVPGDLAFKPGESILAVACQDGKVHVYPRLNPLIEEAHFALTVAPASASHSAGAMAWGVEGTSQYLFASSEPSDDQNYNGFHRAFDINRKKLDYEFDAKEAGDAMALDSHGEKLVLFTRDSAGSCMMRMYDVQRKNGRATWMCKLEDFPNTSNGEVNHARFSPDTIYLAAARSDDITHIYDSRMIGRGVLHAFEHTGAHRNFPGNESYGVVELQWVETHTRRLGLVTGGADGCVRLWDVCKASDDPANGTIIAETDLDIGHFSLGDPYKGERALVVGDSGGGVYIFDRKGGRPWTNDVTKPTIYQS